MTAPNKYEGLIAWLTDSDFAGAFQHLRDWKEIDARHEEAARAIQGLEERVARLEGCLLNIAYMDCHTREGEEPVHELMMRLALECLASTADG